jgi:hypothetical protein
LLCRCGKCWSINFFLKHPSFLKHEFSRGAETYCTLEKVSPKVDDPVIWDDLQNKVFHLDDMLNLLGDNFLVWDNIADAPINISKTYTTSSFIYKARMQFKINFDQFFKKQIINYTP